MHTCVCGFAGCVCTYEGQRLTLGELFLSKNFTEPEFALFFLSLDWRVSMASKPLGFICLCLPVLGIQGTSNLTFTWLYSKRAYRLSQLPSPISKNIKNHHLPLITLSFALYFSTLKKHSTQHEANTLHTIRKEPLSNCQMRSHLRDRKGNTK